MENNNQQATMTEIFDRYVEYDHDPSRNIYSIHDGKIYITFREYRFIEENETVVKISVKDSLIILYKNVQHISILL